MLHQEILHRLRYKLDSSVEELHNMNIEDDEREILHIRQNETWDCGK